MVIPPALLTRFRPARDGLLNHVCRATDDATLAVISQADYGLGADEALADLRAIRDSHALPAEMSFLVGEVLSLTRFSNPDAHPGHQARLFACAVLLQIDADADAANPVDLRYLIIPTLDDATLAQSLVSARVLGPDSSEALATFLTWWLTHQSLDGLRCLLPALGLLVLSLRLQVQRFDEPTLGQIADWVLSLENLDHADLPSRPGLPRPQPFGIQCGYWEPLMAELAAAGATLEAEEVRINIELCGLLVDLEG